MYKQIYSLSLLILMIASLVAPTINSTISIAYSITGNDQPVLPNIPFKHKLYLDTRLSSTNSTIEFSDILEHVLPQDYNNTAHGNFTLDLDEQKLFLKGILNGEIRYYNETLNMSNTEFAITINAEIHGENKEYHGQIRINGSINLVLETQQINVSFDLPLTLQGSYNEDTNTSTTTITTKNAYITLYGQRIDIEFSMKQVTDFNKQTITTITNFKAYSKDQLTLFMFAQILSSIFGIQIQPPIYDPSTGKYVITYSSTETNEIETIYQPNKYLANTTKVDAVIKIDISGKGQGHLLLINFKINGYLDARGDYRKGFSMDKKGITKIKRLHIDGEIILDKNEIIIKINGYGEYYSINLYAVQFTYRRIIPRVLSKSAEGSKAIIEGSDGIKLLLDNKTYNKLIFTPENASLAENLYIVVNGTVLEANDIGDKVMTYRAVMKTEEIRACFMSEKTEKLIIEAQYTNRVVVEARNIALNGKVIESIFGKHTKIEIVFPNTATPIKGEIKASILGQLPKQLPQNTFNLSKVYDITPLLNTQAKLKVRLYFDPTKTPENAQILVAHYVNGDWQIINPDIVNKEEGYVEVTLTSFSPLVVIAKTTPSTTTTTTTYTTTTTTPTTTATETTTTTETQITTTSETTTETKTTTQTTSATVTTTTTTTSTTSQTTTTTSQTTPVQTTTTTATETTQPTTSINTTYIGALILIIIIGLVFLLIRRKK